MTEILIAGLPEVFTRKQAQAVGLSDRQLDRRLATGALVAIRRGLLHQPRDAEADPSASEVTESAAEARGPISPMRSLIPSVDLALDVQAALLAAPTRPLVVSHLSAARQWGLPRPLSGWSHPEFTATSGPTRRRRGLHVRVAPLDENDVVAIDGTALTSPARTLADCLRTVPGRDGLALADAALHRGLTTAVAVLQVLNRQSRWPGVSKARQVLALADPRRESPLESWSAWAFAHTGVPTPIWQAEIRGPDGNWIGRADCWWPDGMVVGESDGRAKYALAAAERGGDARALYDVLQAERRRERGLREVGADVLRWETADVVREPAARLLAHRITAAIAQGQDNGRFIGVVAPTKLPPATGRGPNDHQTGG